MTRVSGLFLKIFEVRCGGCLVIFLGLFLLGVLPLSNSGFIPFRQSFS